MNARAVFVICTMAGLGVSLTGCTDRPVIYKQGEYQGKVDSQPWNNAQFKGDRAEWDKALKARSQGQDEYSRGTPSAK
jgi:hypothetical protein